LEAKNWTNQELFEYVTQFMSAGDQTAVMDEILKADLMRSFLDNREGRLLMDMLVNRIRNNTMQIVSLAASGYEDNAVKIGHAALQISMTYGLLRDIATLLKKGEEHTANKEALKEKKVKIAGR